MLRKFTGCMVAVLLAVAVIAAPDNSAAVSAARQSSDQYKKMAEAIQKDPKQLKWAAEGLSSQEVLMRFKRIQEILLRGNNGKSISYGALTFELKDLKRMQSYPFFEADTKIDTAWLNSSINAASNLLKVRREKLQAMYNNNRTNTPEFKQLYAAYMKHYQAFCQYTGKPVMSRNQARMLQQMKLKKMILPLLNLPSSAPTATETANQGAAATASAEQNYQSGISGSGSNTGRGSTTTRPGNRRRR